MRPQVTLHIGMSLDARIDWLKSDQGLYYQLLRDWRFDAMLSGSNTMLAAPMQPVDAGTEKYDNQYLVVVDSRGRIENWEEIQRQPWWNSTPIVCCSETTPTAYRDRLAALNLPVLIAGTDRVDLAVCLAQLYDRFQIRTLRVDSGGILSGVLLRAGLIDEVSVVILPQLTGGTSQKSIFVAPDLSGPEGVVDLVLRRQECFHQNYLWLVYEIINQRCP